MMVFWKEVFTPESCLLLRVQSVKYESFAWSVFGFDVFLIHFQSQV